MDVTTLKIPGSEAIQFLNAHRARYPTSGLYPFLIGDAEDRERLEDTAGFDERDAAIIIGKSLDIIPAEWILERREEAAEDGLSSDEFSGKWPGEIREKGSIALHKDFLTGEIKPEIYIGIARIEKPWHLPAVLKYGAWNDCPPPEVHCAFHRGWYERFGAEITGASGDIVECIVRMPPNDQKAAIALAWEQYRYCADIVEQGCGSVSNLAATLLDSPYWYFWWD